MKDARTGGPMKPSLFLFVPAASLGAFAGGSNYNVTPGTLAAVKGQGREWDVPTPKFARDPALGPDGTLYIAVINGNKIAHFDPRTQKLREWDMPASARPHRVLVDKQGMGFYT